MKINLEKLRSEKKISGCYSSIEIIENAGYKYDTPLEVCYTAQLEKDAVGLDLKITGGIKLQCDRCLGGFVYEVAAGNSQDIPFGEFGEDYDIDEEARQLTVLSMPLKRLCGDYCKGICPVCGTDLNKDKCSCNLKPIDPRFEKLKKLKI
jgi:uncharacterized protein